jgi:hypothetical protein
VDTEAAPAPGEPVHVSVRRSDLHLFDATTGERRVWT